MATCTMTGRLRCCEHFCKMAQVVTTALYKVAAATGSGLCVLAMAPEAAFIAGQSSIDERGMIPDR